MNKFRPYIHLMLRYPLNLLAAFLAAMFCSFLLTMGPGLIKVFISEASRGVEKQHLMAIALMLIVSLFLSYVFDIIQGHISAHFKMQIEAYLRTIYQRYCQHHRSGQREMAHGRGIYALTEFCHHLVLDIPIGICTIVLISSFMMLENTTIGLSVLCLSFIFLFIIIRSTARLGRLSRFKELLKQDYLKKFEFEKRDVKKESILEHFIERLTWAENKRIFWDNLIIFCSFTLFRIIPSLLLFTFALEKNIDFAKATSLLLSFNLLHRPFLQLVTLYKQAILFYAQSSLIRPDLEAGMEAEQIKIKIPKGLVAKISNEKAGVNLGDNRDISIENSRIFHLDCQHADNQNRREDFWPKRLQEMAHEKDGPILVYCKNTEAILPFAHFICDETGNLNVACSAARQRGSL